MRHFAHPAALVYSVTTLGAGMMNSIFSFYYVSVLQIFSKMDEIGSQLIRETPLKATSQKYNSRMECCSRRRLAIFQKLCCLSELQCSGGCAGLRLHDVHGFNSESRFNSKTSEEGSQSPQKLPLSVSSVMSMTWQILTNRDFQLFVIMNFIQAFCNNFTMIFTEHLIPQDVLPSLAKSVMYGAGFRCIIVVASVGAAVIVLLLGPGHYYFLALFLTSNIVEYSCAALYFCGTMIHFFRIF
uniref:Uncharacterized protein n=1 Tax=Sinocyclocheilus anshuiensis TaxID=1608454 RepID=A0A671RED9_9TELE